MSVEEVLNRHRTTLLAYAKKNKHNVLDIKEEVVSGESIARRPKMLELLEEVEENKYDAVLVMDIDRLGRGNMREQGLILETFKEYNTKIITPNKVYDLHNEFDEEYSEFEAFMSRRELKIIKKRLMRGRMKSLEEGNYIGAIAPFGYEKKGKTLKINKEQATVVKLIFQKYVKENYGNSRIANYLIDKKIPTSNDNLSWDKTTIRSILKNPVYTGRVVWGKKRFKYDKDGNKQFRLQNKDDWLIHEGKHEAIIDQETFEEAQRIAEKRHNPTKTHKTKELRNPLAGLLKCGACGSTMTIRTAKNKTDSIRCYKNCGGVKSSYIHLIEQKLIEKLLIELEQLKFSFNYKKRKVNDTEIQVVENTLQEKNRNIATLMEQREKLYDFLEQGIYDNDTFLERMNTLTQKINAVNSEIQQLQTNLSKLQEIKHKKDNLIPEINNSIEFIEDSYFKSSAKQRNDFLKSIIEKVTYTKDKKAAETDFNLKIELRL